MNENDPERLAMWLLNNHHRPPGWQNWQLSDDLLILRADGGFDAVEYERQIREGLQFVLEKRRIPFLGSPKKDFI